MPLGRDTQGGSGHASEGPLSSLEPLVAPCHTLPLSRLLTAPVSAAALGTLASLTPVLGSPLVLLCLDPKNCLDGDGRIRKPHRKASSGVCVRRNLQESGTSVLPSLTEAAGAALLGRSLKGCPPPHTYKDSPPISIFQK